MLVDPDLIPHPFGLADDHATLASDWHRHARPQLLYAISGSLRLETRAALVLLPPERAAWIPAGIEHRASTGRPLRLRTVYFDREPPDGDIAVFEAPPLLREMARQACAWGLEPPARPEVAPFFAAFRHLVRAWADRPLRIALPSPRSPAVRRGLDRLLEHLDRPVGVADAAAAAGMSERTFQRRCRDELGVNLQSWLVNARMVRALELLADPELPIGDVALRCGYDSPAAFARVFARVVGEPPTRWRARRAE